jgi:ribosome maturation factor RimP
MALALCEKIRNAINDALENKGYDLIQVNVVSGHRPAVDISIDRRDGNPVSVEDCAVASRLISVILDVEDIVKGKYNLNVSSPGKYRQLASIEDFERFFGQKVKIELISPMNGKKKISGELVKVEQNSNYAVVYLKEECNTGAAAIGIDYKNIKRASVKRIFKI